MEFKVVSCGVLRHSLKAYRKLGEICLRTFDECVGFDTCGKSAEKIRHILALLYPPCQLVFNIFI